MPTYPVYTRSKDSPRDCAMGGPRGKLQVAIAAIGSLKKSGTDPPWEAIWPLGSNCSSMVVRMAHSEICWWLKGSCLPPPPPPPTDFFWSADLLLCVSEPSLLANAINTHYHNSNLIWRTVSYRVDEVIPSDHPRRVASRVIQWYGLIHETWYCTPDKVTITIMFIICLFSDILSDFKTYFGL